MLTWGGLRGGISVALALSLPHGPARDTILTLTYVVVVFSILVQGLSIKPLIARLPGMSGAGDGAEGEADEAAHCSSGLSPVRMAKNYKCDSCLRWIYGTRWQFDG